MVTGAWEAPRRRLAVCAVLPSLGHAGKGAQPSHGALPLSAPRSGLSTDSSLLTGPRRGREEGSA